MYNAIHIVGVNFSAGVVLQALEQGLDVSEIEDAIAKADALFEKAQKIARANPIPACNMAREAAQTYENAVSDLEALIG